MEPRVHRLWFYDRRNPSGESWVLDPIGVEVVEVVWGEVGKPMVGDEKCRGCTIVVVVDGTRPLILGIVRFVDSRNRRSISGVIVKLRGGEIHWSGLDKEGHRAEGQTFMCFIREIGSRNKNSDTKKRRVPVAFDPKMEMIKAEDSCYRFLDLCHT